MKITTAIVRTAHQMGVPVPSMNTHELGALARITPSSKRTLAIVERLRQHASTVVCDWSLGFCFRAEDTFRLPGSHTVYFVTAAALIKIGVTTNLSKRLGGLGAVCPVPVTILTAMPGSIEVERALHRRFASFRLHGEWFRPAPELTEFIDRLCRRGRSIVPALYPTHHAERT